MGKQKEITKVVTHQDRKRRRLIRGYLPYWECVTIVGIKKRTFLGYIKAGRIPPPEHTPECYYYTIDQLRCLIEAKFCATIDKGSYTIFDLRSFTEYVQKNWPPGEEDEQVRTGKKASHWRRRDNHRKHNAVQSGGGGEGVY